MEKGIHIAEACRRSRGWQRTAVAETPESNAQLAERCDDLRAGKGPATTNRRWARALLRVLAQRE